MHVETAQAFDAECGIFCRNAGVFNVYEQPLLSVMPRFRPVEAGHVGVSLRDVK